MIVRTLTTEKLIIQLVKQQLHANRKHENYQKNN